MGYFLLFISVVLSAWVFPKWLNFALAYVDRSQASDLADQHIDTGGTFGLWSFLLLLPVLLPKPIRRLWNYGMCWAVTAVLGLPHFFSLWLFFQGAERGLATYVFYPIGLAWWLFVLFLPASVLASQKVFRAHQRAAPSDPQSV